MRLWKLSHGGIIQTSLMNGIKCKRLFTGLKITILNNLKLGKRNLNGIQEQALRLKWVNKASNFLKA
jgi:hypothetical protein